MDGKMHRKKDIDDIAYRLRCETKRSDLPAGVVQKFAEAYLAITILQRHIKDLQEGFEGCCPACELVGEKNKTLRAERDEARRLYCEEWAFTIELERGETTDPSDLAAEEGWDCYLQRKKSDAALDELARLDEELGLIEPPNKDFLQDLG